MAEQECVRALVVAEIALAVVLLIGAALLIRASLELSQVDPGFDSRNLLTLQTSLSGPRFATTASIEDTLRSGRERVRAIPGVVDVVTSLLRADAARRWGMPFNIVGRVDAGLYTGSNGVVFGSPGYFDTLGIPVLRGRPFNEADGAGAPPVAIINEALARRYWPDGADPFGDRMVIGGGAARHARVRRRAAAADRRHRRRRAGDGSRQRPGAADLRAERATTRCLERSRCVELADDVARAHRGDPAVLAGAVEEELRLATGLPYRGANHGATVVALGVAPALALMVDERFRLRPRCCWRRSGSRSRGLLRAATHARARNTIGFGSRASGGYVALVLRKGIALIGAGVGDGLVAAFISPT